MRARRAGTDPPLSAPRAAAPPPPPPPPPDGESGAGMASTARRRRYLLRPRFSRTRTEICSGVPSKPNSSRSRRSMKRR